MTNGVIAGAMVQALFIGQITPGGAMPADVNWAAYIGIPLAMAAGGTGEQAVALSVPLSMLGLGLFNFIMTINAYFPHMGDKAAAKGDGAGIHRATYLAAAPSFILRAGSAMLICYLGTPVAETLINNMPQLVLHFFEVAGKMLPALGICNAVKAVPVQTLDAGSVLTGLGSDRIYQHVRNGTGNFRNRSSDPVCYGTGKRAAGRHCSNRSSRGGRLL